MSEISTVSFEVLELTRATGKGRLVALAQVAITIDGVEIMTQGWRVFRRPDGLTSVEPPCYRHTEGDMVPAIVLPEELEDEIARHVLRELSPPATLSRCSRHRAPREHGDSAGLHADIRKTALCHPVRCPLSASLS